MIIHSSFRELIIQVVGHACLASISRSSLITPALSPESVIKGPPIDVSNCTPQTDKAGKAALQIKAEWQSVINDGTVEEELLHAPQIARACIMTRI